MVVVVVIVVVVMVLMVLMVVVSVAAVTEVETNSPHNSDSNVSLADITSFDTSPALHQHTLGYLLSCRAQRSHEKLPKREISAPNTPRGLALSSPEAPELVLIKPRVAQNLTRSLPP